MEGYGNQQKREQRLGSNVHFTASNYENKVLPSDITGR